MAAPVDNVSVRPLRHGERDSVARVFAALSERSRRLRFLGAKPILREHDLDRLVDVGCCGREAFVATARRTGEPVGIARYVREGERSDIAEVAFEVADEWQGRGIGTLLAHELARRALADGVR